MDPIIITCTIKVADAIAAGRNKAGRYDHELTAAQLASIKEQKLYDTAFPYLSTTGESNGRRLAVKAPTWDAVLDAIRAARETASTVRRRHAAEANFLVTWGTPNQSERHHEGTLGEDELLLLARKVAFSPFEGFDRYDNQERLTERDVRHRDGCAHLRRQRQHDDDADPRPIEFDTVDGATLTSDQHRLYQDIRRVVEAQAPNSILTDGAEGALFALRSHVATCPDCGYTVRRATVLVTLGWLGRNLSREFTLGKTRLTRPRDDSPGGAS